VEMMRLLAIGLLALACTGAAPAEPINLFVSPQGNDAWSGSLPEPTADGTDGPFATIAGARDAIRTMKASAPLSAPINVQVRGGVYRLSEPLVFTPEDSGRHDTPITYQAYAGEEPVLSGGVAITGWQQDGDRWVAHVDGVGPGPAPFSAIWVNGEYRHPARSPNEDFFYTDGAAPVIKDPNSDAEIQGPTNAIKFAEGDIQHWQNIEDALVVSFHSWDTTHLRITKIDDENNILVMDRKGGWPFNRWAGPRQRYYVEHIIEGLDAPGEWYLNRKTGDVYYLPMPGETMDSVEVIAPMLRQVVKIEGDLKAGAFVEHLHFQGLKVYHTDYSLGPEGMNNQQASSSVIAAFHALGGRHCSIEDCEVAHVSTYGIWFGAGCQDNRIFRNHVHDLGAGGVRLGEGSEGANEFEVARHNVVDNNWIHDGGKIFMPGVGVWIGRSSYNTVSHNEISDFYYTGISVGWSWGYAASSAHNNIIEYNHIHHLGKRLLSDMGGIYTLGIAPGTVLRYNLIHDVFAYDYGGWGIYPDEGSTDLLIENNVVYNTKTGGFHQHYGKENRVMNNIFAYTHEGQIQRTRTEDHRSFFFERNIVYFNNGRLLSSNWKDDNYVIDFNCYWDESSGYVDFLGLDLDEWRQRGHDKHSIIADPLFENPQAFDFRLKPDSPALELGFRPIDISGAGLYGDPAWVDGPKVIEHPPSELPEPFTPTTVDDDFEGTDVGQTPASASVSGETDRASIRVTDETAASGAHALKITDAQGLERSWNPHLFYKPLFKGGNAAGSFDVRMEPGAALRNEWRTAGEPYKIGPAVIINGAGMVSASGRELMTIPHGQWTHIEIECVLGGSNTSYAVTITVAGQEPKRFEELPFGDDRFRVLQWFGFIADADADVACYLDNIRLVPVE